MNCRIRPRKGKDIAHDANEERQGLRLISTLVQPAVEYGRRGAMLGHICERDQDGEEAQNMKD